MSFGAQLSGSLKFYRSEGLGLIGYRFLAVPAPKASRFVRQKSVRKITFSGILFAYLPVSGPPPEMNGNVRGNPVMKAKFRLFAKSMHRAKRVSALGIFLTLIAASSASALGTPEQRRACTPDVYRLCAGEIPNVKAITACLMRQKGNLSPACRTAMEQNGY